MTEHDTGRVSSPQMCTVDDWIGGDPCLRVAQHRFDPEDDHPVFLCNFHAEPFILAPRPLDEVAPAVGKIGEHCD